MNTQRNINYNILDRLKITKKKNETTLKLFFYIKLENGKSLITMSVELMSDISQWISFFVNFRNAGVSTYIIFYISYTYKIIFLFRKSNAVLFIKFKDKNTVYYFQAALNH